jgi:hypothetical protein
MTAEKKSDDDQDEGGGIATKNMMYILSVTSGQRISGRM